MNREESPKETFRAKRLWSAPPVGAMAKGNAVALSKVALGYMDNEFNYSVLLFVKMGSADPITEPRSTAAI